MNGRRATIASSQLIIVDIQERLIPHIHDRESMTQQAARFIRAAGVAQIPVLLSEQYVKGLGASIEPIRAAALDVGARRIEKLAFSVLGDAAARAMVSETGRRNVYLVGIETHVCVQQTVLDLLDAGYRPIVLADAVGSRRASDREVALSRMQSEGAVITTVESAIYELLQVAGTELFKRMLPIVKD